MINLAVEASAPVAPPPPTIPYALPPDFVPRPDEYERIVAALLGEADSPVAISAALRGAGGYGKTTLAIAACHDERVRAAFPAGMLWVTLGERPGEADLVARVADLVERLTGERPGYSALDTATAALVETLSRRRLLLVIDDVWDAAHLRPFLQGGPQVTRLITTRNRDTLPAEAQTVDVDAMRQAEAVDLLAAGIAAAHAARPSLQHLTARLGEWPLLLKIVNGVLREQVSVGMGLDEALGYVWEGLDEEGITVFDTASVVGRSQAVVHTLAVSLATLSAEEQQRFAELAIFPEDASVPLVTLQRYWGLSAFKVRQLCARLFSRSLLLAYDGAAGTIRLHDVVRAYLVNFHADKMPNWHIAMLTTHRPLSLLCDLGGEVVYCRVW